jgi:hypothetical protein
VSDLRDAPEARALLKPRRVAVQVAGFAAGILLLAWIVVRAAGEGDWRQIAEAPPALLAALLGCTLASTFLNGASFWITVRPIRHLPFADLQRLNIVANMLNYAPVRLGAIARVVYHARVDRLGLLEIGAWFAVVAAILILGAASVLVATLARERVDEVWALLAAGQMALGVAVFQVLGGLPLAARYGHGLDRIARDGAALWSAAGIRALDLGTFVGRMAAAMAILDIHLGAGAAVVLAMVALAASLIPFGRLGFREFCVMAAAERLGMMAGDVESRMNQLALVESAGEALVFLPLGLLLLPWLRRRLRAGRVQQ